MTGSRIERVLPPPTDTYARALDAAAANTQRLLAKLTRGVEDASVVVVGDSTGNATDEWVYLLAGQLGALFPEYTVDYVAWDDGTSAYLAATEVQAGTGAQTLTIYNASVSGTTTDYALAPNFEPMVGSKQPDLVIVSHGHNEGASAVSITPAMWRAQYLALTETITAACPYAGMLCIGQNPATSSDDQLKRASEYSWVAQQRGYGFIDVGAAFLDNPDWSTELMVDAVHPNAAGQALWVDRVMEAFVYQPYAPIRVQTPSAWATHGEQLLDNGDFGDFGTGDAVPAGWTASNATLSKDLTNYQSTNGYSVKIEADAAAQSYIQKDLRSFRHVRGKWVTAVALVRRPAGQATSVGRLSIIDSAGSATSRSANFAAGDFFIVAVSKRIDAAATYARVRLYGDTAASAAAELSVDSIHVTEGVMPRRALVGPPGPTGATGAAGGGVLDFLSTFGNHPANSLSAIASRTLASANSAISMLIRPHRDMSVSKLKWSTGSATSGNYDIGILDYTGARLWAKGSTAWPAINTVVDETVSPVVALVAGELYWVVFWGDNTTGTFQGGATGFTGQMNLLDGTAFSRLNSIATPIPASLALSAGGSTRVPFISLHEV